MQDGELKGRINHTESTLRLVQGLMQFYSITGTRRLAADAFAIS